MTIRRWERDLNWGDLGRHMPSTTPSIVPHDPFHSATRPSSLSVIPSFYYLISSCSIVGHSQLATDCRPLTTVTHGNTQSSNTNSGPVGRHCYYQTITLSSRMPMYGGDDVSFHHLSNLTNVVPLFLPTWSLLHPSPSLIVCTHPFFLVIDSSGAFTLWDHEQCCILYTSAFRV